MSGISCSPEENNNPVILFIGAGTSFSSGVRTASDLKRVIEEIQTNDKEFIKQTYVNNEEANIQGLADYLESTASPSERYAFKDAISRNLYSPPPIISPEYRMLAFLIKKKIVRNIYTTNQDVCLERALDSQGILYNRFVYPYTGQELSTHANGNVDIFKLCGDIHTPYKMCFSTEELQKASESILFKSLIEHFNKNCRIVFIGYSASDDPIGHALYRASDNRQFSNTRAKLYCVDITKKPGHIRLINKNYNDSIIEKTAEQYLTDEIFEINPKIIVRQALLDQGGFGGIQTYVYSLMELFEKFKLNITSDCFFTKAFYNDDTRKEKKAFGFSYDLASGKAETIKIICKDRPDIIHAHNFISAYTAETLSVPCVFTSHSLESKELEADNENISSTDISYRDPFSKDISRYEELYYHRLPVILALSQSHIKELHESVQPSTKQMMAPFLPPEYLGIDTTVTSSSKRKILLQEQEQQQKQFQELYCITSNDEKKNMLAIDTPTVSFFGRSEIRKGLHVFIKAVEILHEKGLNFQVLYVGPNIVVKDGKLCIEDENLSYNQSYYDQYKDGIKVNPEILDKMFIAGKAVGDYKTFKEHLKKMYDYYLASDIIIMPSTYETFGYVALEAMACRRPVIASGIGGLNELLSNGRGTLIDINVCNGDNPTKSRAQKFAASAEKILENGAAEQTKKAKEWVDQEYSIERGNKLAEEMYNCYLKSIIRGRKIDNIDLKKIDEKMRHYVDNDKVKDWETLLTETSNAYQDLRSYFYSSSTKHTEFYDLFWHIAYWLKSNKSIWPEVCIMSIRDLAELITEVTRFFPEDNSLQTPT